MLGIGLSLHAIDNIPFTYHLGAHFGENYADGSSKMRDNALYGIRATMMMTPFYGIGIGYDRMESIDIKESHDTVDAERYYIDIEVDGEEQYHTVPYITFGVGYENLSKDVMVGNETDGYKKYDVSQLYLTGGLGFRYNFIPELSLYAEGNALYKTDTTDIDYTLLAGLQYHLNATTCDKTYITDRVREKPQEKTVMHVGAVNQRSGWNRFDTKRPGSVVKKGYNHPIEIVNAHAKHPKTEKQHAAKMVKKRETAHRSVGARGYYVMMGAFKTQKGLQNMVRKLQRSGTPYILRDSRKRGVTYVMAGAYPSALAAKRSLDKLHRIASDAYIAKLK